ncbi:MAG: type I-B CRISPR-associated protein Cas8b1/Cst1 [Caldilineaceae bacterium]|nr:type I-B CRISPR-associated protein Cas8b1/Cst1 [Caldilineaceae bacterium]
MSLLRYTGHPFVDVGVATITAMSRQAKPEDVTYEDLERVAQRLKEDYSTLKPLRNHISSIFLNSWFVQPSKTEQDRQDYADAVLFAFRAGQAILEGVNCIFFPEKAAVIYAHRQHLPLLNGADIWNFSPLGTIGIPVSGEALLAIHAMPYGCTKCGYPLAFHQLHSGDSSVRDMTLYLANRNYRENARAIHQMRQDESAQMPNWGGFKRTRYVEALLQARREIQRHQANALHNITGYYFTNYGPKPMLELIRVKNNVADFIDDVEQDASDAWRRVVWQGWQLEKGETTATLSSEATQTRRNVVYEMLFDLPENALPFLRRLAVARDWSLIQIFLERILLMDAERIETYRKLGDRLAQYIIQYEGGAMRKFYYDFSRSKSHTQLYRVLRNAWERMLKAEEKEPLFTYEEFVLAFEHPSDGYSQWQLGRDLISFRMLEVLHKHGVDASQLQVEDGDTNDENE